MRKGEKNVRTMCDLLSMEPWAAAKKALCFCGGATSQRPLAPRVASVTSVANDKGDNDPGGCAQISWHLPYSRGKPPENII